MKNFILTSLAVVLSRGMLLIYGLFILCFGFLFGCDVSSEEMNSVNIDRKTIFEVVEKVGNYEFIVKDKKTGCHYIQSVTYSGYLSYSPYYNEEGIVLGCGVENSEYKY